jgi:hypothetical protein
MSVPLIKPLARSADAGILGISGNFVRPWPEIAASSRNFYIRTW